MEESIYFNEEYGKLSSEDDGIYTENPDGKKTLIYLLNNAENSNKIDSSNETRYLRKVELLDYGVTKIISYTSEERNPGVFVPSHNGYFFNIKILSGNNKSVVIIPNIKGMLYGRVKEFYNRLLPFLDKKNYDFYVCSTDNGYNLNYEFQKIGNPIKNDFVLEYGISQEELLKNIDFPENYQIYPKNEEALQLIK